MIAWMLLACSAPGLSGQWDGTCETPRGSVSFTMFGLNAERPGVLDGATGEHDAFPVSIRGSVDGVDFEGGGDRVLCTDPEGCAFHPVDIPADFTACEDAIPEWMQYDVPEGGFWLDLAWPDHLGFWGWGTWDGESAAEGGCALQVPSDEELRADDLGPLEMLRVD